MIILRTPAGITATFSDGVTVNGTTTSGSQTVAGASIGGSTDLLWTITAASNDTVTFT